jgi:phenylacetate-CoA ligase
MRPDEFDQHTPWRQTRAAQAAAAVAAARRAHAIAAYRAEWAHAGIDAAGITEANWSRLPLLSKEALVESARRAPPWGERLGVPREALAHVFVAPGPLYMPFTAGDLDHAVGSFAKALAGCGFRAGDLVDQTTMYNWVIAATALDRAILKLGCGVVPGGIGQSERHLEVIADLGVNAILAFPTFLEHLLDEAAAAGRRLPLTKAAVMGEMRDPQAKVRIAQAHGIAVREFYGVADVGAVAWECEAGNGMHLRDDLLVEFVVPGETHTVEPAAGSPGEIVVTDFHRQAMPIIRLRTGDLIDGLVHEPCACGRTSPRFTRIVGRASEITKVKGMFVVPRQVVDVMRRDGAERPFRLLVDRHEGSRDALTLEVAGEPYPDREGFKARVESALRMQIALAFVPSLPENGPRLVDRRFGSGARG